MTASRRVQTNRTRGSASGVGSGQGLPPVWRTRSKPQTGQRPTCWRRSRKRLVALNAYDFAALPGARAVALGYGRADQRAVEVCEAVHDHAVLLIGIASPSSTFNWTKARPGGGWFRASRPAAWPSRALPH